VGYTPECVCVLGAQTGPRQAQLILHVCILGMYVSLALLTPTVCRTVCGGLADRCCWDAFRWCSSRGMVITTAHGGGRCIHMARCHGW
jgi:hypothetical protein